jgi:hypothetical protein
VLELLHRSIYLLAKQPAASGDEIALFNLRFPSAPEEYLKLVEEATEVELQHEQGQYIRIWGPSGCIDMDEGYNIAARMPSAIPIGDDGGGKVLFYLNGTCGRGLYHVGYGDLAAEDAIFTAPNLTELLQRAVGIETFYR